MRRAAWERWWPVAMPAVFVLIWSTGFVVARFGMPHAPPFTFLCWRYALSIGALLLWVRWAGASWPQCRAQCLAQCCRRCRQALSVVSQPCWWLLCCQSPTCGR